MVYSKLNQLNSLSSLTKKEHINMCSMCAAKPEGIRIRTKRY